MKAMIVKETDTTNVQTEIWQSTCAIGRKSNRYPLKRNKMYLYFSFLRMDLKLLPSNILLLQAWDIDIPIHRFIHTRVV